MIFKIIYILKENLQVKLNPFEERILAQKPNIIKMIKKMHEQKLREKVLEEAKQ